MKTKALCRYVVSDTDICHGEPSFRGTRILVADVLEQITNGMDWQAIIEEWRGKLSREVIAEAIRMKQFCKQVSKRFENIFKSMEF